MQFDFLNILLLLGAVQGFTLCIFLYKRRSVNPAAYWFLCLCLFSLGFFNFTYALHYSGIDRIGFIPLDAFPLPYKYLIGVGAYLYVRSHTSGVQGAALLRREWYWFLPALVYGLLRSYWYSFVLREGTNRIIQVVDDSGFFIVNEFVYLFFDLVLAGLAWRSLQRMDEAQRLKNRGWLKTFLTGFGLLTVFSIVLVVIDLSIHRIDTIPFYYPTLIVNSLFIYWIGYVGFSKPSSFFSAVRTTAPPADKWEPVQEALRRAMEEEEVFTNAKLTLPQFAQQVGLPARDITQYVNEVKGMNFSEYLNHYRVKKVQRLMLDEEAQRYTLIALAEAAGFSSKSSFNAIFKKEVGQTPTEFLRSRNAT